MDLKNVHSLYSNAKVVYRGDIFYIKRNNSIGREQMAGRPAIIVSNDKCNQSSRVKQIVYLTTEDKTALPTHVTISTAKYPSTALCEQIMVADDSTICEYIGHCTDEEMRQIDKALSIQLNLENMHTSNLVSMFNPGEDEVLKSAYEYISKTIETCKKIAAINSAIELSKNNNIVNVPRAFSSDDIQDIQQYVINKLLKTKEDYYKQLRTSSNTNGEEKEEAAQCGKKREAMTTKPVNAPIRKKRRPNAHISEETLRRMYVDECMSKSAIAQELDVHPNTVSRFVKMYEIER